MNEEISPNLRKFGRERSQYYLPHAFFVLPFSFGSLTVGILNIFGVFWSMWRHNNTKMKFDFISSL